MSLPVALSSSKTTRATAHRAAPPAVIRTSLVSSGSGSGRLSTTSTLATRLSLAKVMTYANDMPQDTALASDLRTTVMRLARRLRQQRSDTSLSLGQIAALGTLDRHGPMTPGELAAHERVQPPSMTRIVAN